MSYTDTHPSSARLTCRTCAMTLATDNPIPLLVALFRDVHDGHDTVEEGCD